MLARRRIVGLVLTTAVLGACTSSRSGPPSASGGDRSPATGGSPSSASASPAPPAATIRVASPKQGSVLVHGRYPHVDSSCKHFHQPRLAARYPGLLSFTPSSDGTWSITVTLPFEQYLDGIAEMPPSWPMAALEAQAVAARSYALANTGWSGQEGDKLATPICASTNCQVYGGLPVGAVGDERRWWAAVQATQGQVLLYGGRPADTVYFSTSNGHTYGNDQVFGSSPLPYLRPVVERNDGASPVSRWSVAIRHTDLASFLERAGDWPSGVAIDRVGMRGGAVRISGPGTSRSMSFSDFRDVVNAEAPCLEPRSFPPAGLPSTIPSSWASISDGSTAVTVGGRGWGHGVGMVQWGAYGKARLGWSADRILAYYYGGLLPQTYPEPGLIHVRVASGLSRITLIPSRKGAKVNGKRVGRGAIQIGAAQLAGGAP